MNRATTRALALWFAAAFVVASADRLVAQDSLASARDLYASAAYEDALVVLNRLRNADHSSDEGRSIEQYRAFCLLALGRTDEAERAIEAVVAAQPSYHPSESDVSPRLRLAFSEVRRRMLPSIIQTKYAQAKGAFDRKDYQSAAVGFKQVLDALDDSDVGAAANQPPLSDIRTLASGFRDLSAKASAPPPPPAPAPVQAAPAPVARASQIYGSEDGNVVPPLVIKQTFPPFPARMVPPGHGVVEVIIDEIGTVEAAALRMPVNPQYDALILSAARTWLYKPAMLDGVPVKYRKLIQVVLRPTTR